MNSNSEFVEINGETYHILDFNALVEGTKFTVSQVFGDAYIEKLIRDINAEFDFNDYKSMTFGEIDGDIDGDIDVPTKVGTTVEVESNTEKKYSEKTILYFDELFNLWTLGLKGQIKGSLMKNKDLIISKERFIDEFNYIDAYKRTWLGELYNYAFDVYQYKIDSTSSVVSDNYGHFATFIGSSLEELVQEVDDINALYDSDKEEYDKDLDCKGYIESERTDILFEKISNFEKREYKDIDLLLKNEVGKLNKSELLEVYDYLIEYYDTAVDSLSLIKSLLAK